MEIKQIIEGSAKAIELYQEALKKETKRLIENNKYYNPNIEDIRVGYKCEKFSYLKGRYENIIIGKYELHEILDEELNDCYEHNLRTPYLTKEQIEAEGWKEIHYREYIKDSKNGVIHFFNGNKENKNDEQYLSTFSLHNKNYNLFEGECPSINEFRTICKLLNIK